MLKIFKKLQLKLYFPIFFLLCFLLLYLPLVNSLGDSIYATLFLLLGFYVLFFFQNDTIRYPLAGFLFTLAIFTRINTIIPFGLAVLYHSKKFFYKEGKFTFDYKEAGFTAFLFLLPVFLLSFF
ncbi:hypothetical protein HZB00_03280 [Candidatus Woesearchaeota archaeon]|nr:hypothetical protein [Candidatus Woesearchaeota archaeon]